MRYIYEFYGIVSVSYTHLLLQTEGVGKAEFPQEVLLSLENASHGEYSPSTRTVTKLSEELDVARGEALGSFLRVLAARLAFFRLLPQSLNALLKLCEK